MVSPQVVIVTGLSGAGRSHSAKVLEDLGYFVVDNLPPVLMADVVDRVTATKGGAARVAVVADTRGGLTADELEAAVQAVEKRGAATTILFLDADDAVLARRFEETRRTHPVREGALAEKIAIERATLEDVRGMADVIIDTSELNVHELRRRLESAFAPEAVAGRLHVDIVSFGFKRGLPRVVDLLFDVRFLPNPHWVPDLRPQTGLDPEVRDYVLGQEDAVVFLDKLTEMLEFLVPRYDAEGKSYLTIAIGCTGGRHRSVAIAEEVARRLGAQGQPDVAVVHRDIAAGGRG
jgi:UPF0042 nucleotide-binding protein